jgi:hypothetical protein
METVIETEGVILAFELIELGDDDKPLANLGTVDIETIAKGWQALLAKETEGGFCHCGRERNSVREAEKALKEQSNGEEYDACVIDAVIQMAMFGELKYG